MKNDKIVNALPFVLKVYFVHGEVVIVVSAGFHARYVKAFVGAFFSVLTKYFSTSSNYCYLSSVFDDVSIFIIMVM